MTLDLSPKCALGDLKDPDVGEVMGGHILQHMLRSVLPGAGIHLNLSLLRDYFPES